MRAPKSVCVVIRMISGPCSICGAPVDGGAHVPQAETIAIHCAAHCPICSANVQENQRTIRDENRLPALLEQRAPVAE